jgi:hypothetical protein
MAGLPSCAGPGAFAIPRDGLSGSGCRIAATAGDSSARDPKGLRPLMRRRRRRRPAVSLPDRPLTPRIPGAPVPSGRVERRNAIRLGIRAARLTRLRGGYPHLAGDRRRPRAWHSSPGRAPRPAPVPHRIGHARVAAGTDVTAVGPIWPPNRVFSCQRLPSLARAVPSRQGGGRWFEPSIAHSGRPGDSWLACAPGQAAGSPAGPGLGPRRSSSNHTWLLPWWIPQRLATSSTTRSPHPPMWSKSRSRTIRSNPVPSSITSTSRRFSSSCAWRLILPRPCASAFVVSSLANSLASSSSLLLRCAPTHSASRWRAKRGASSVRGSSRPKLAVDASDQPVRDEGTGAMPRIRHDLVGAEIEQGLSPTGPPNTQAE